MRTYRAQLARWRLKPLHKDYLARAKAHAQLILKLGAIRRIACETTCPYCGTADQILGTIRLGAKEQVTDIPMTREGYTVPDARDRETEILVINCPNPECQAAIDRMAYMSPANFAAEALNVEIEDIAELKL